MNLGLIVCSVTKVITSRKSEYSYQKICGIEGGDRRRQIPSSDTCGGKRTGWKISNNLRTSIMSGPKWMLRLSLVYYRNVNNILDSLIFYCSGLRFKCNLIQNHSSQISSPKFLECLSMLPTTVMPPNFWGKSPPSPKNVVDMVNFFHLCHRKKFCALTPQNAPPQYDNFVP